MIDLKDFIFLFALSALVSPTYADIQKIGFSPYVDFTLSTHWDAHYQDLEPMDLVAISQASNVKSFHLAFITDAGACNPAWGGQSTYSVRKSWGNHVIDNLHANNINYIISFGGANGNDLSQACNENQLIDAYQRIINVYHPQGLDFDIENGTADVVKIMDALQKVQAANPNLKISFTLPVMPEGLIAAGKEVVHQAQKANLNYSVNIMAMDYGASYNNDMGEYAIQAASNLFTFLQGLYPQKSPTDLWQMIEVTPMIGVNDVNVEQFTLLNAERLRNFVLTNKLKGLSMWSMNRDAPCADKWASNLCSGNNLQTKIYEFSQHLMGSNF